MTTKFTMVAAEFVLIWVATFPLQGNSSQAMLVDCEELDCEALMKESKGDGKWANRAWGLLVFLGGSLAGAAWNALQPHVARRGKILYEHVRSKCNRRKRINALWKQINPKNLTNIPETDFKEKAKDVPLFKYLIDDGLSMDWLFKEMDPNDDNFVSFTEFEEWHDRLNKFRPDADASSSVELHTAFVGRSRVGKSTLLNSILGRAAFDARVMPNAIAAGGVTPLLPEPEMECREGCPRSFYVNLPGFLRPQEKDAIKMVNTKALTRNAYVKLVFVVVPDGGAITPETQWVLQVMLDISEWLEHYAIIVNKCSPNFMALMEDKAYKKEWIQNNLLVGLHGRAEPTVFFFPENEHATDARNYIMPLPDGFKEFLFSVNCNNMYNDSTAIDDSQLRHAIDAVEKERERLREVERKRKADGELCRRAKRAKNAEPSDMCVVQ